MQNFTKTDLEGAETLWRSVTNHPHDMHDSIQITIGNRNVINILIYI